MTFVKRKIDLTFQLGTGSYGESGFDTVAVSGLRASVTITRPGSPSFSKADIKVWGMTLDVMNQLTTIGPVIARPGGRRNIVTIMAGDDDTGMPVAFTGDMLYSWVDPNDSPSVSLNVTAQTGQIDALKPVAPSSFRGPVDAATIMQSLATQANLTLENSGVSVMLSNQYLAGTIGQQMEAVRRAANFNMTRDGNVVAIWPKGGTRNGEAILISKDTGMVGYPAHTDLGISITSLYNANVRFGGQIEVQTVLTPAAGTWTTYGIAHELESEVFNGKWFTHMEAVKFGNPIPPA